MKILDLDKLPADSSATSLHGFLGVSDDEIWAACKEYERRMKDDTVKDSHEKFGLKRELIIEVAKEVSERNLTWIREHFDKARPMGLMKELHKSPRDKPAWTLKLLRRHGLGRVELVVWVAADSFLSKWVEKFGRDALGGVMSMMSKR